MLISFGVISAGIRGVARLFAIIDITISTINLALLNPDLRNRLNKTEAGKWFVSHWGIISFCVSMGTISYYLAKGIVKYVEQIKQQLSNEKELSKQIDELVVGSKRVVNEATENIIKKVNVGNKLVMKLSLNYPRKIFFNLVKTWIYYMIRHV